MTINYNNQGEAIKEWTNVLGLSTTPTSTDTPKVGLLPRELAELVWLHGSPGLDATERRAHHPH